MPFSWPKIRYDQSVAIIGPKGSGKTLLMKALLRTKQNAVVCDTKLLEDWSDVGEIVKGDDVYRIRSGRFVYRADEKFLIDDDTQSRLFLALLRAKGPRIVAIDEALDIMDTHGIELLAKQGRAAKVSLWAGSQRPFRIALYMLSEADHFFVFSLALKRDRERMEEVMGGAEIPWADLRSKQHHFIHYSPGGKVSEPTLLRI